MSNTQDTLLDYGHSFQHKTIAALITDITFLEQSIDIIDSKLFSSNAMQWLVDVIIEYFKEYRKLADGTVFESQLAQIQNSTEKPFILDALREVVKWTGAKDDYVKKEFINFARNQNWKRAVLKSAELVNRGNYDEIERIYTEASKAGLARDIGMIYKNPDAVTKRLSEINRNVVPTPWDFINEIMDGGLGKGELGLVMAPAGVGKSWLLIALGAYAIKCGKNVLHYTLELDQDYVGKRYDAHYTGMTTADLKFYKEKVLERVQDLPGELIIRDYPTKTATIDTIIAHIDKCVMVGHSPDLLIVDYADLILSDRRFEEKRFELDYIYERLRGVSGNYAIPCWSASQTNRTSMNDDFIQGDRTSESIGKNMIADFIMTLSRKQFDRVRGTGRGFVVKNRMGQDGICLFSKVDTAHGYIDFYEETTKDGSEAKEMQSKDKQGDFYRDELRKSVNEIGGIKNLKAKKIEGMG